MEWLGQIGGIAGIAALIGVILGYLSNSRNSYTEEFKAILNGLQIQLTNSQHENGRLLDKIDKLENKIEKLTEEINKLRTENHELRMQLREQGLRG
jgi:chromosome segregation ATPase